MVTLVVGSAGVAYGWTPLSPGYNDVTLWGSVCVTAACLRVFTLAEAGRGVVVRHGVAIGVFTVIIALAKWASAVVVLVAAGTLLVLGLAALRARGWSRLLLGGCAGMALAVSATHLLVVPLDDMVPPMLRVNARVAASANSPVSLLLMYVRTTLELSVGTVLIASLVLALVGAAALRHRRAPDVARMAAGASAPVVMVALFLSTGGIPGGGVGRTSEYTQALSGLSVVVLTVWLVDWWPRLRSSPRRHTVATACVVLLCIAMPVVQALGTGNPVFYLAVSGFALWFALMLAGRLTMSTAGVLRAAAVSATLTALAVSSTSGFLGWSRIPTAPGASRHRHTSAPTAARSPTYGLPRARPTGFAA